MYFTTLVPVRGRKAKITVSVTNNGEFAAAVTQGLLEQHIKRIESGKDRLISIQAETAEEFAEHVITVTGKRQLELRLLEEVI